MSFITPIDPSESSVKNSPFGVDFGTTYSLVSQVIKNKVIPVTSLVPSVMLYRKNHHNLEYSPVFQHELYGEDLYHFLSQKFSPQEGLEYVHCFDHKNESYIAIGSVKRLLCPEKAYEPIYKNITPFDVAQNLFQRLFLLTRHSMEDMSLKTEESMGAIITVPAYFSEPRRQIIKKAAQGAHWKVIRLLSEPSAAALYYLYGHNEESSEFCDKQEGLCDIPPPSEFCDKQEGIYGVYDLGGGTFDISLIKRKGPLCRVLQTKGHVHLGGDDIDELFGHCFKVSRGQGRLLKEDFSKFFAQNRDLCQEMDNYNNENRSLFWGTYFKTYGLQRGYILEYCDIMLLTQGLLDLWEKTWNLVEDVLKEAHRTFGDLQGFILTGGSSRFPLVFHEIQQNIQKKCPIFITDFHGAVSKGAALQGKNLMNEHRFLFLDVTPLSLGLETLGGLVERLIPRGSPLPATGKMIFTTGAHNQCFIHLHILQGEGELTQHCFSLGHIDIPIDPQPKGQVRIQVVFSIDDDGLLKIQAFGPNGCNKNDYEYEYTKEIKTLEYWVFESLGDKKIQEQINQEGKDLFQRWWIDLELKITEGLKEIEDLWNLYVDFHENFAYLYKAFIEIRDIFFQHQRHIQTLQLSSRDEDYLPHFQEMKKIWDDFSQLSMGFLNSCLDKKLEKNTIYI